MLLAEPDVTPAERPISRERNRTGLEHSGTPLASGNRAFRERPNFKRAKSDGALPPAEGSRSGSPQRPISRERILLVLNNETRID